MAGSGICHAAVLKQETNSGFSFSAGEKVRMRADQYSGSRRGAGLLNSSAPLSPHPADSVPLAQAAPTSQRLLADTQMKTVLGNTFIAPAG